MTSKRAVTSHLHVPLLRSSFSRHSERLHHLPRSLTFATLSHLQSQQIGLWTACGFRIITLPLIEKITALVQGINLTLTFLLFVRVLLNTICNLWSIAGNYEEWEGRATLNGTLGVMISFLDTSLLLHLRLDIPPLHGTGDQTSGSLQES